MFHTIILITSLVGINVVGVVDFVNNPINLLLRADDSAEYVVDTRIRIEEYVLFWRAETYGLFTVFQQQEYDISLELQNVAVRDGDYVGIELNIELCHNSVTIDQLESEYNYYNPYLSNSQCLRNYGEVVLSNSHFRRISGGITVHKQGGFSVSASSFIQFVNLAVWSVLSTSTMFRI